MQPTCPTFPASNLLFNVYQSLEKVQEKNKYVNLKSIAFILHSIRKTDVHFPEIEIGFGHLRRLFILRGGEGESEGENLKQVPYTAQSLTQA